MKARVFTGVIPIDPSARRNAGSTGYNLPELANWLLENPNVEILHLVQSQTFEPATPMFVGALRIAITVFFEVGSKK
jgi:hypothetical protein